MITIELRDLSSGIWFETEISEYGLVMLTTTSSYYNKELLEARKELESMYDGMSFKQILDEYVTITVIQNDD